MGEKEGEKASYGGVVVEADEGDKGDDQSEEDDDGTRAQCVHLPERVR